MLSHLIRQSRQLFIAALVASVVSGVCSVLLVAQINRALTVAPAGRESLALVFAAVAVGALISHVLAAVLFERLGQKAQAEMRRFISHRVLATDFRRMEEIGGARIQSALSEHSAKVAEFFVSFPAILVNGVVVGGCLIYMAMLSLPVFLSAIVVIGLGSVGYHLAHVRAIRHLDVASREQDRLFGHFRSLVDGAKELRLNRRKREVFSQEVLGRSIDTVRHERALGMSIFLASASWGNFLIYAFIGLVLFVLVGDVPDRARIMTGFALVFVYMTTPLEALLINLPRANLARVSAARIDEITRDMDDLGDAEHSGGKGLRDVVPLRPLPVGQAAPTLPPGPPGPFTGLSLRGVRHRYYHEGTDDLFTLGPVDLDFAPSQITFLVGGNGSGKTTLAKLITGLYAPESGEVRLNGVLVDTASRDEMRQIFAAVFSDFHLFDRLLAGGPDVDVRGNRLIGRLQLQHKVQVQGGAFTTRELSQGQRKRLALVEACLEDRPFFIFDEWAADQDPLFKDVFYREVLPELRAMGKTVLVISHDDRYFHLADRLVRMESGQVLSQVAVQADEGRGEAA